MRAGGKALIKTFHHHNNYDNALSSKLKQLSAGSYLGQCRRATEDSPETSPDAGRVQELKPGPFLRPVGMWVMHGSWDFAATQRGYFREYSR
jgi:hypothetical protein